MKELFPACSHLSEGLLNNPRIPGLCASSRVTFGSPILFVATNTQFPITAALEAGSRNVPIQKITVEVANSKSIVSPLGSNSKCNFEGQIDSKASGTKALLDDKH